MARRIPPKHAAWEKLISHHLVGFSVLAVLACAGATFPAQGAAQGNASQPNFAPTSQVGWTALTSEFIMPPTDVTGSKIAMLNDTCGNLVQVTQLMRW